jgi:WD40 repeat protein
MPGPYEKDHDLFISYAEPDRGWAEGCLAGSLRDRGVRCLTQAGFRLGAFWTDEFARAVRQSHRIVLVLSGAYLADVTQRFVENLAQYHALKDEAASVIPLLYEDLQLPLWADARVCLRATTEAEGSEAVERLAVECRAGPPGAAPEPECPYPGMLPFTQANADYFCGRKKPAEELLQELRHRKCLFLIGPSGSGKTSLVWAGLVPALEKDSWHVSGLQPGATPAALLAAQTALVTAPRHLLVVDQFEQVFTQAHAGEAKQFQEALAAWVGAPGRLLIVTVRSDFYQNLLAAPIFPLFQANHRPVVPLGPEGLREAIVGPAAKVNVYVERALMEKLVADAAGEREPGVLPHLQEALQLLWGKRRRRYLPLEAYTELGREGRTGLQVAMAVVADAAVDKLLSDEDRLVARRLFLRLIQFGEGRPDTRRRQPLATLRGGEPEEQFDRVRSHLEANRLLVSDEDRMEKESIPVVDIAHEALIAGWPRLQGWARDYRAAERGRRALEDKAAEWKKGGRGLLDRVELPQAEKALADLAGAELVVSAGVRELAADSRRAIDEEERAKEQAREEKVREAERLADLERKRAATALELQRTAEELAANDKRRAETAVQLAKEQKERADIEERERQTAQSLAAAESRRSRLARRAAWVVGVLLVAVTIVAIVANSYRIDAVDAKKDAEEKAETAQKAENLADARRLGALASTEFQYHPDTALLLAYEAYKKAPTFEVRNMLFTFMTKEPSPTGFLDGNESPVRDIAFSADGKAVVVVDTETIQLWDLSGSLPVRKKKFSHGLPGEVNVVAFSPDGKHLACGGTPIFLDGKTRPGDVLGVWDCDTGQQIGKSQGHGPYPVVGLAFSHEGTRLAWCEGVTFKRHFWDWKTDRHIEIPLSYMNSLRDTQPLAFGRGGVLATSSDIGVILWDVAGNSPREKDVLDGSTTGPLAFSPDGSVLATWDRVEPQLLLWNLSGTKPTPRKPVKCDIGEQRQLVFNPDGKSLSCAGEKGVQLWDVTNDPPTLLKQTFEAAGTSRLGIFGLPGRAYPKARRARQWNSPSEGVVYGMVRLGLRPDGNIILASTSPHDGESLVLGNRDNTVVLWDSAPPGLKKKLLSLGDGRDSHLDYLSPGGRWAITWTGKRVVLWDLGGNKPEPKTLEALTDEWKGPLTLSPDGGALASFVDNGEIAIWDVTSSPPALMKRFVHGHSDGRARFLVFSHDGKQLVSGGGNYIPAQQQGHHGELRLWDWRTGHFTSVLPEGNQPCVRSVAFSPDDKTLAVALGNSVIIWDVDGIKVDGMLDLGDQQYEVLSLAFSPDGKVLTACGGFEPRSRIHPPEMPGGLTLWAIEEGKYTKVLYERTGRTLNQVAVSQAGTLACSGYIPYGWSGKESAILFWDIESRLSYESWLPRGSGRLDSPLAFFSDGKTLASGGLNATIDLWDWDAEAWAHRAGAVVHRNFNHSEWARFFPSVKYARTFGKLPPGDGVSP